MGALQCNVLTDSQNRSLCSQSLTSLRWFESVETGCWDHAPRQQCQFLLVGKLWESLLAGTGIADWKKTHTDKKWEWGLSAVFGTLNEEQLETDGWGDQHSQSRTASCALWLFDLIWGEKYCVVGSSLFKWFETALAPKLGSVSNKRKGNKYLYLSSSISWHAGSIQSSNRVLYVGDLGDK